MQRRSLLKAAIFTAAAGALSACAQTEAPQDIVDIAASNPEFSTLVTAVQAAGLVDTLKSDGPFTVFAPTNAAFAALPEGTLDTLLEPENKGKLAQILTYHVVPGQVTSDQLAGQRMNVATVEGSTVHIERAAANTARACA